MSIRVSLRGMLRHAQACLGMLRLIRIDTLRRVLSIGFLAGRLIYINVDLNQITQIKRLIWIYTNHITN